MTTIKDPTFGPTLTTEIPVERSEAPAPLVKTQTVETQAPIAGPLDGVDANPARTADGAAPARVSGPDLQNRTELRERLQQLATRAGTGVAGLALGARATIDVSTLASAEPPPLLGRAHVAKALAQPSPEMFALLGSALNPSRDALPDLIKQGAQTLEAGGAPSELRSKLGTTPPDVLARQLFVASHDFAPAAHALNVVAQLHTAIATANAPDANETDTREEYQLRTLLDASHPSAIDGTKVSFEAFAKRDEQGAAQKSLIDALPAAEQRLLACVDDQQAAFADMARVASQIAGRS